MTSEYKRDIVYSANQHFDNVVAIILSGTSKGSGLNGTNLSGIFGDFGAVV